MFHQKMQARDGMSLPFSQKRLVSTRRRRRRRRRRRSCAFGRFLRDSLGDFGAQGGGEAQSDRGGAGSESWRHFEKFDGDFKIFFSWRRKCWHG